MTHKELILKSLYFYPKYTSQIYLDLINQGEEIGVHSITNRLQEAAKEGKIIGEAIEGHKEKRWRLVKYDKEQGMLF